MKRRILFIALACLAFAPIASATMMRQEWWTGVGASRPAIIDFLGDLANPVPVPDLEVVQDTSDFSGSRDNYVAKFYGWVTVPADGAYQFHYACDDYGMLYVSQDEEMANAVEVAYVDGWCAVDEWNKYPSQHSEVMNLKKGQIMAVMAFFQEAGGGDHKDPRPDRPRRRSRPTDPPALDRQHTHHPPPPPPRAKTAAPGCPPSPLPPAGINPPPQPPGSRPPRPP